MPVGGEMHMGEVHTQARSERGCAWQHVHHGQDVCVLCARVPAGPPARFQGLSPVVALVDGVDHVPVHQAWLLITLPLPFLLTGAGGTAGKEDVRGCWAASEGRGGLGGQQQPEVLYQCPWQNP